MKRNTMIAVIVMMTGFISQNAFAKNFYKASLSMTLTYSNAFKKTQTLERNRVQIVMSDDEVTYGYASFCQLKIEQKIYKCQSSLSNRKNYTLVLDSEVLKQILQAHFGLSTSTVLSLQMANENRISRSWSSYSGTERKTTFQYHTEREEESYHLNVTARKARLQ